jgi:hypothetical protein
MDFCRTPSTIVNKHAAACASGSASLRTPSLELQILDQISRMSLNEQLQLRSPQTPYQTPVMRKRKPSFVTPPRRHPPFLKLENTPLTSNNSSSHRKKPRSLAAPQAAPQAAPMLPGSPEMEATLDHNPFNNHRPVYSPVLRTSHVNIDFMATLQEVLQQSDEHRNDLAMSELTSRRQTAEGLESTFPNLEMPDDYPSRKVLKMRRCTGEYFPFFSLDHDL